jgi:uncharacterized protein YceH (UPF0502 family)
MEKDMSLADSPDQEFPPLKALSRPQRRVLGVLIEKAFTTPEVYPLTLKAATTGCNQKSNRDPVTHYSEDDIEDALQELREAGLAAVVHTESGRTERFRHYMRHRLTLTEPQLAILGELLLRGRQSLGDLRARASRMVPVESLEQLRRELQGLMEMNLVRSNGEIERRGAEVDHSLYEPGETAARPLPPAASHEAVSPQSSEPYSATLRAGASRPAASDPPAASSLSMLEKSLAELRTCCQELQQEVAGLRDELQQTRDEVDRLKRDLGA